MTPARARPPEVDGVDLDFRPASYWAAADALGALIQNVKGQNRREMIAQVAGGQSVMPPGSLDDTLLDDELTEGARTRLVAIHPSFLGGEYLPGYMRGETEIARLVLASVTQDVYSLRARRGRSGRIRFRMVDEYESEFVLRPATARQPLSLRQLVTMLDTVEGGFDSERGLLEGIMFNQLESDGATDPSDIAGFITVESTVYPGLERYYDTRLLQDATVLFAEHRGDEENEEEYEDSDDDAE